MQKFLVWDLPVRLFHWLLVICIFAQWFTVEILEDATDIHFYIGYFTLGLIIFRLIWGIVGTTYARFSNFMAGPKSMLAYLKSLTTKEHTPTVGHNSVGGWMLPAVLLLVGLQATSGLFITDDIINEGPYYASASDAIKGYMMWLHHNIFNALLALIVVHLLAIFYYRFILKHDLISPMFSGKKEVKSIEAIPSSRLLLAAVMAMLVATFVYWLVAINPPVVEVDYYY
ncbi:cytochrome b/b6 domain-containing protein [uncultured Paraglaciecola sp.]|uniref:cytochrome b/b6 domain-containing protein n=1 Tax=uncultured Paraglaciecola sp. TaxID=1765024 RepID=UPI002595B418|nr:cytochrome b/b6 domain-containing protein [uncultured Paraglaciecola sp.]